LATFGSSSSHIFILILPTEWHVFPVLTVTSRFPCRFCRSFLNFSIFSKNTLFCCRKKWMGKWQRWSFRCGCRIWFPSTGWWWTFIQTRPDNNGCS